MWNDGETEVLQPRSMRLAPSGRSEPIAVWSVRLSAPSPAGGVLDVLVADGAAAADAFAALALDAPDGSSLRRRDAFL